MFADFTRSPYQIPKWFYIVGIVTSALIGSCCFTQTELFVRCLPPPAELWLKNHISNSQKLQAKVADAAKVAPQNEPKVVRYCSSLQKSMVDEAYDFVMKDPEVQTLFFERFQTSLKDVRFIVVYSWKLTESGYLEESGVTRLQGWDDFVEAQDDPFVSATTIREKPDGRGIRTLTGTPVIILKPQAFASKRSVRFNVFHELVHAMNIPGYRHKIGSQDLTRGQTDLAYLREYRWFVAKHDLSSWDSNMYGFFAALLLGICGLLILKLSAKRALTTTAKVYVFLRVATENFSRPSRHQAGKK